MNAGLPGRRLRPAGALEEVMVSFGSTGATAAATFGLRRLKGVQRPALAVQIPVPGKPVLFLRRVGANVEVRAQHTQSSSPSSAPPSARRRPRRRRPTVGLLTVSEESGEGRGEVVEAHRLLDGAEGIEFAGNVEVAISPAARIDVVVTDGFTGNVALKLMEGTASRRRHRGRRVRPLQPGCLRPSAGCC